MVMFQALEQKMWRDKYRSAFYCPVHIVPSSASQSMVHRPPSCWPELQSTRCDILRVEWRQEVYTRVWCRKGEIASGPLGATVFFLKNRSHLLNPPKESSRASGRSKLLAKGKCMKNSDPTRPPYLDPPTPNQTWLPRTGWQSKSLFNLWVLDTKSFSVAAPILADGRFSSVLFI